MRHRTPWAATRAQRITRQSSNPLALVYSGPASLPGCPEAVADLLAASARGFRVDFVGPDEHWPLSAASLAEATLYAQPGGADLEEAYRHLRPHRDTIRRFVADGGRYLGFCLGSYLAGATPGFDLLPGDTDQYIGTSRASVDTDRGAIVEVSWRGHRRHLYFQDGPLFQFDADADVDILARYPNRAVAAAVTSFGRGRVGVVGPHPEASADWFIDAGLSDPGHHHPTPATARGRDLGLDLIEEVMTP